jgi:hypothetical protein
MGSGDVKFVWEPARFGWAFTLGRAYHLLEDEAYPETFWRYLEEFLDSNPVNMGPNWASAQEVALRVLAFCFSAQIFAASVHTTLERMRFLAQSLAQHAARIPITFPYAHAQNNNHLLSESLGLITASLTLPEHPEAEEWSRLGWKWFNRGLETQIGANGAYLQHSTNYHRLVLQLALWAAQFQEADFWKHSTRFSRAADHRVQKAVHWLLRLCDPTTGRVPNLGPNDGAYILPLTCLTYADFRPVLQAASNVFLGKAAFQPGSWDEICLWLGSSAVGKAPSDAVQSGGEFANGSGGPITILETSDSWAYFRSASFDSRPGHADQLHLDLWWRGLNVARDAGTYLYNAPVPWDNALTHTGLHNTVVIDEHEQMTRVGRFLYLDWAQAEILNRVKDEDGGWERVSASHDGYHRLGVVHQRRVTAYRGDRWLVEDLIQALDAASPGFHEVRLHWLLPDWDWDAKEMGDSGLQVRLYSPHGWIDLFIEAISAMKAQDSLIDNARENAQPVEMSFQLIRCGELIRGSGKPTPILGWFSPTYGIKLPALSLVILTKGLPPIMVSTEWSFPDA